LFFTANYVDCNFRKEKFGLFVIDDLDQTFSTQAADSFGDGQQDIQVDDEDRRTADGLYLNIRAHLVHIGNVWFKTCTF